MFMVLISIFLLFGCAVNSNHPSQLLSPIPDEPKTDVCMDDTACSIGRGIVFPEGKSLAHVSLIRMNRDDHEKAATLVNTEDDQVPYKPALLSVSLRATLSSIDVLGEVAPVGFREYGVAANFRLPWAWYSRSGWGGGIRLLASAGALYGSGETALVVSLIPLIAFGSQDGRYTLDMGAGGALLSRKQFGAQDCGGYFQFALTAGVGVPLSERLGMGYRFTHYSDAGIHGPYTVGADLHMLEFSYRF
jgi:hypothetical protein